MKKVFFTLALALGLTLAASAQEKGLFGYAPSREGENYSTFNNDRNGAIGFSLPDSHGGTGDSPAPLGTGTALLLGLGAAYLVGKKKQKK